MFKKISTGITVYKQALRKYFKKLEKINHEAEKYYNDCSDECENKCDSGCSGCSGKSHFKDTDIELLKRMQTELGGIAKGLGLSYKEIVKIVEEL